MSLSVHACIYHYLNHVSFFEEFLGPIALLMDCPFLLCKPFLKKNEIAIFL